MKFRDKIGSEAVREIIREARERASKQPRVDFLDQWPDRRSFVTEATRVRLDPSSD